MKAALVGRHYAFDGRSIPVEGGTHVRMEQSGFRPDQKGAYQGANNGWQKFLGRLEPVLAALN